MKISRSSFFLLANLFLALSGCKYTNESKNKNEKQPTPLSILDYYDMINRHDDGRIATQSHTVSINHPESSSQFITGGFHDSDNNLIKTGLGPIYLGDHILNPDPLNFTYGTRLQYESIDLYGKKIKVSFTVPQETAHRSSEATVLTDSLYVPKEIYLTYPLDIGPHDIRDSAPLSAGSLIRWNNDEQNKNGVVVALVYTPLSNSNSILDYPKQISKVISVKDLSSGYTLGKSELEEFPIGSIVELTLARGNYTTIYSGGKTFSCYATTSTAKLFKIQ